MHPSKKQKIDTNPMTPPMRDEEIKNTAVGGPHEGDILDVVLDADPPRYAVSPNLTDDKQQKATEELEKQNQPQMRCYICQEVNPEQLTSSLCNHAVFCFKCVMHLMIAESSSDCRLCKDMHSSFIRMMNPLILHKLLMAYAQSMNPNDQQHDHWKAYQVSKLKEITRSLETINTLGLVLHQQRSYIEHQIQIAQEAVERFHYAREYLPHIQSQWFRTHELATEDRDQT